MNIHEAAEKGTIARSGTVVAKLMPLNRDLTPRPLGAMRGQLEMAGDFDEPLPREFEAAFYGVTPEELDQVFPRRASSSGRSSPGMRCSRCSRRMR